MPVVSVRVPDIGDFEEVEVIEVLVAAGDRVELEDALITLESDKATMEIPSPHAGIVGELHVALGDLVGQGTEILTMNVSEEEASAKSALGQPVFERSNTEERRTPPPPSPSERGDVHVEVAVLGSGPGGYTAAFRAADLGKTVALIERYPTLGGVCLNVGCIPSKALLHMAEVLNEAREMSAHGIDFGQPQLDIDRIRAHKSKTVETLTSGLAKLARQRKIQVVTGSGSFSDPHLLEVETPDGTTAVSFDHAIIAAGSQSVQLPGFPHEDPRVMDSTDALELSEIPARILVIGGGVIGLEMATVYDAFGSEVTVVELLDALIPGADPDLVRPLYQRIRKRYANIFLSTRVTGIEPQADGLRVTFEGEHAPDDDLFDRVLVAVGRRPNGAVIGAERAGVEVDGDGFIRVDKQQRTNVGHIFAIGDITGDPMLAHKATHEGRTAAEVIAGLPASFDAAAIPSVAYTDPEVAWMGTTEAEAKAHGLEIEKASFPWAASGRSLSLGRADGLTKLIFSKETGRLIGAGVVGKNAGELIAETVLALELGADAQDLGLSIHPHPTLSETVGLAADMVEGTITDLYAPRGRG
jgi:dihydrolipoamide dehydrogenase